MIKLAKFFVAATAAIVTATSPASAGSYRISQYDAKVAYCGYLLANQAEYGYERGIFDYSTKQYYLRHGAEIFNYIRNRYGMSDSQVRSVINQIGSQQRHGSLAVYDQKYINYCLKLTL